MHAVHVVQMNTGWCIRIGQPLLGKAAALAAEAPADGPRAVHCAMRLSSDGSSGGQSKHAHQAIRITIPYTKTQVASSPRSFR